MEKKWVKFLKDYNDGTTGFKKDQVIQIDVEICKALIALKTVEETVTPSTEDNVIAKATKEMTDKLTEMVEGSLQKMMAGVTEKLRIKKSFALPIDHDEEGMRGFKTSGEFIRSIIEAGKPGGKMDDRFLIQKGTPSGQSTMVDDEGAVLIPETMAVGIWEYIIENDELLAQTDQRFTSGQSLKIKRMPKTSKKQAQRAGGMIAYWMSEADLYTPSLLKWGDMRLELHKLGALAYTTDEELADAEVALPPIFESKAGAAIMFLVQKAFYDGTGAGMPQGIMNSPALKVVALEVDQDQNTINHYNINKMFYAMPAGLRAGAEWWVHPDLEEQLNYITFRNENTAPTNPIYMPPGGLSASPFGTLMSKRVRTLDYCMDFGQKGDICFVNMSQYVTLLKAGANQVKSQSSIHVRFLYDETAFKFSFRIDGQSMWSSQLEDLNGTTKRSPFITLASRSTESSSSGL